MPLEVLPGIPPFYSVRGREQGLRREVSFNGLVRYRILPVAKFFLHPSVCSLRKGPRYVIWVLPATEEGLLQPVATERALKWEGWGGWKKGNINKLTAKWRKFLTEEREVPWTPVWTGVCVCGTVGWRFRGLGKGFLRLALRKNRTWRLDGVCDKTLLNHSVIPRYHM